MATETSVLTTVLNLVYEISTEWQPLGALLGLDPPTLRSIGMQNTSPSTCLMAVLEWWIKGNVPPGPYWEHLGAAVGKLDVAEAKKIAEKIAHYYKGSGLTPIQSHPPDWYISGIIQSIVRQFPKDDDTILKLKLLANSLFPQSSDDLKKIEKLDQPEDIFLMLQEQLPGDIEWIVYDILCQLNLQNLIPPNFCPSNDVSIPQLTTKDYLFAKCLLEIAQKLTPEDARLILSTTFNNSLKFDSTVVQSTTPMQLLYVMKNLRMFTSTYVTRLYDILMSIDKEKLALRLTEYLTESGQEPISKYEVVYPSIAKPVTEIKIIPLLPTEGIAEIRKTQQSNSALEPNIQKLVREILVSMEKLQSEQSLKMLQDQMEEQRKAYEEKIESLHKEINELSNAIGTTLESSTAPHYPISKTNRGYALIINNFSFTAQQPSNVKQLQQRYYSEFDEFNMYQLFGVRLGYQPVIYCNVNHTDIKVDIERYTKNFISDSHDSFVCIIFSWGTGSHFYSSDGVLLNVNNDILPYLDVPALKGKPKIVFVCTVQNSVTNDIVATVVPPNMADVLIVCATLSSQEHVSEQYGFPYVETFFQTVFNKCKQHDLVSMLTMINDKLIRKNKHTKQIMVTSLTKQMKFFAEDLSDDTDSQQDIATGN